MSKFNKDMFGMFWVGTMVGMSIFACIDYYGKTNAEAIKEKTLIELKIELSKLEIKRLNRE